MEVRIKIGKDKDKPPTSSPQSPTYSLLLCDYSTKPSPLGYLWCGVDELVDLLSPLDTLHRSNPR